MNPFRTAGVALLLVGAMSMAASCGKDKAAKKAKEYDVQVMQPTRRSLSSSYSATIRGKQDIDIRPKVSGYITAINVREGATVRRGQTLFVVDQVPYQAALQTAQANVDVAQAAVDAAELTTQSKEELFRQDIISSFDLSMARTQLAAQRAQLAQARANEVNAQNNLSYTEVKSPADGVIGTLPFRVGTLVSPSDSKPLTSVSDNSEMYVYFSMTESQVLALARRHGSLDAALAAMPSISLQLSDGSVYSEKGRIETISGIIDPTTGSVAVRAKFPNSRRLLLSGGSGNVIVPYEQENCLVIPQDATFEIQDKTYVYRLENGVATARIVAVSNISDGHEYIVQQGLEKGDTIVVEGVGLLRDRTAIRVRNVVEVR